jgi:hypothetical protein
MRLGALIQGTHTNKVNGNISKYQENCGFQNIAEADYQHQTGDLGDSRCCSKEFAVNGIPIHLPRQESGGLLIRGTIKRAVDEKWDGKGQWKWDWKGVTERNPPYQSVAGQVPAQYGISSKQLSQNQKASISSSKIVVATRNVASVD